MQLLVLLLVALATLCVAGDTYLNVNVLYAPKDESAPAPKFVTLRGAGLSELGEWKQEILLNRTDDHTFSAVIPARERKPASVEFKVLFDGKIWQGALILESQCSRAKIAQ